MTKPELVHELAIKSSLRLQESKLFVDAVFDCIKNVLQREDRVVLKDFGSWRIRVRKAYVQSDPRTASAGGKISVPPKRIPMFRASKKLQRRIENS